MTEIETYTIRMDEEENPMLEQITRGGKKTQKAYSKRLDALYNLLGEKEKLISGHVRKSLEWCDKRSKVSREAKKPYNDLEADALKDLETRLRKELPEDAIASMLKDVGSVNQVRAYNLLPHYRDDIIDSLSPG